MADQIEPPGMRASRLKLEREAISEVWCDWNNRSEPYGASEGEIEHSKAISAKRQADALERIADVLAGELGHPEYGIAPTLREIRNNMR